MRVLQRVGVIAIAAAIAAPVVTLQAQDRVRGHEQVVIQPAFDEGYRHGLTAGEDHARRGQAFNFNIAAAYRQGDIGFRVQLGSRDRYRDDFRAGFERGYRESYARFAVQSRGPGVREGRGWLEIAVNTGYQDGYAEGLNDGRWRHRNDPFAESRYRSGDHGFDRRFGNREAYRGQYRDGFRRGYERGYEDGRRR